MTIGGDRTRSQGRSPSACCLPCPAPPSSLPFAAMKLSVSTLACPNGTVPQVGRAAAAHGFAGIDARGVGPEIDITRLALFGDELAATLDLLRNHGLTLHCLNTSVVLVTTAPDGWDA